MSCFGSAWAQQTRNGDAQAYRKTCKVSKVRLSCAYWAEKANCIFAAQPEPPGKTTFRWGGVFNSTTTRCMPHDGTKRRDEVVDWDALLGDSLHVTAGHGIYTLGEQHASESNQAAVRQIENPTN